MKNIFFLFFWLCIASTFYTNAQLIQEKSFQDFIAHEALASAHVGVHVVKVNNGQTILDFQSSKAFLPASTNKVSTTAAAYLALGEKFKFQTHVYLEGIRKGDIFDGWLIIKGNGDPGLGSGIVNYQTLSQVVDELVQIIKSSGIKSFSKGIWIDPYFLPYREQVHDNISGGVIWEDIGNYYATGLYGLNVFQNRFEIQFRQKANAGDSVQVERVFPVDLQKILKIRVATGPKGSGDLTYISPHMMDGEMLVQGTIPPGSGTFTVKGSIADPPAFAAQYLLKALKNNGVIVDSVKIAKTSTEWTQKPVLTYHSPGLLNLLKEINEESNNIFAEGVLRAFGFAQSGKSDLKSSCKAINDFWLSQGINLSGCRIADGSGLSRLNLQTPAFQTAILRLMANRQGFVQTLAISGKSGTFRSFCNNPELAGNVKGKSGGMSGVLAYCGYFTAKSGEQFAFSVIINNFTSKNAQVKAAIEKLLLDLYKSN